MKEMLLKTVYLDKTGMAYLENLESVTDTLMAKDNNWDFAFKNIKEQIGIFVSNFHKERMSEISKGTTFLTEDAILKELNNFANKPFGLHYIFEKDNERFVYSVEFTTVEKVYSKNIMENIYLRLVDKNEIF